MSKKVLSVDNIDVIKDYILSKIIVESDDIKRTLTEENAKYLQHKLVEAAERIKDDYDSKVNDLTERIEQLKLEGADNALLRELELRLDALKNNYVDQKNSISKIEDSVLDIKNSVMSPGQLNELINTALIEKTTITDDMIETPNLYTKNLVALIAKFGTVRALNIIGDEIEGKTISAYDKIEGTNDPTWKLDRQGDGYLANKNISWDKDGNVTFGENVKIGWGSVTDTPDDFGSGISIFTSTVFTRNNTKPSKPTGGSYGKPTPTQTIWSDGIPDGDAILWASTRVFASDGGSKQQTSWSEPVQMTDTATLDIEYSSVASNPGNPTDNPGNWSNDGNSNTIWMATATITNGVKSAWTITKIKGEDGKDGNDGAQVYLHIKYAESVSFDMSGNVSQVALTGNNGEDRGPWQGMYSDYTEADSNDVKKYKWFQIDAETAVKTQFGAYNVTSNTIVGKTMYSTTELPLATNTEFITFDADGKETGKVSSDGTTTGPAWQIKNHGDGYLAAGNIRWDSSGNLLVNGQINGAIGRCAGDQLGPWNASTMGNVLFVHDNQDSITGHLSANTYFGSNGTFQLGGTKGIKRPIANAAILIGDTTNGNGLSVGTDGKVTFGENVTLGWDNLPEDAADKSYVDSNKGMTETEFKTTIGKNWIETENLTAKNLTVSKVNTMPDNTGDKVLITGNKFEVLNSYDQSGVKISNNKIDTYYTPEYLNETYTYGADGDEKYVSVSTISQNGKYLNKEFVVDKIIDLGIMDYGAQATFSIAVQLNKGTTIPPGTWNFDGDTKPYVALYKWNDDTNEWEYQFQRDFWGSWQTVTSVNGQAVTSGATMYRIGMAALGGFMKRGRYALTLVFRDGCITSAAAFGGGQARIYTSVSVSRNLRPFTEIGNNGVVLKSKIGTIYMDDTQLQLSAGTGKKWYGIKITDKGMYFCNGGSQWRNWEPSSD